MPVSDHQALGGSHGSRSPLRLSLTPLIFLCRGTGSVSRSRPLAPGPSLRAWLLVGGWWCNDGLTLALRHTGVKPQRST